MLQVELNANYFPVKFTHTNDFGQKREYEGIEIQNSSQSRIYFNAIKNGIRYTTISKKMQFDDNRNVFVKFGKNKIVIGSYKEIA